MKRLELNGWIKCPIISTYLLLLLICNSLFHISMYVEAFFTHDSFCISSSMFHVKSTVTVIRVNFITYSFVKMIIIVIIIFLFLFVIILFTFVYRFDIYIMIYDIFILIVHVCRYFCINLN